MLPVTHGAEYTRLQVLLYTILLLIVTLLPYLTGMSGLIYFSHDYSFKPWLSLFRDSNDHY